MKYLIGYDIGGTKIELVILEFKSKKIIYKKRVPTERERGYRNILSKVSGLFREALLKTQITPKQINSIGFALPGSVQNEIMIRGNTQVLEGKPIKKDLQKILRFKSLYFENDANCFALAEHTLGVGKRLKARSSVGIILGTGMGSGMIIADKIFSGKRGTAGEIGHIPISGHSIKCYCGQKDCSELYLSGPGFKSYVQKYIQKHAKSDESAEILISKYKGLYKKILAKQIAATINFLDPDYVVLGGGISRNHFLYKGLNQLVRPHLFVRKSAPPILKHKISDSAGSVGAALLAVYRKKN